MERKLARQHVDSRIAEMKQQHDQELNCELTRAPLAATKILGISKPQPGSKVQANNIARLSAENDDFSFCPPLMDDSAKINNGSFDKENNPEIAEQLQLPKQTGRASLCPALQKISVPPASRRNSLIPLPSLTKLAPSFLPLTPIQAEDAGTEITSFPEQIPCGSPKDQRARGKKLGSALRRSLQKKIYAKSPMQQPLRRIGVNVGMEKVRVSIGSRGRLGQRVFLGNARRGVTRDNANTQPKQNHREKERGWNIGTAARTLL